MIEISTQTNIRMKKLSKTIGSINKERLSTWVRFGAREAAEQYTQYVKFGWLSGKALDVRTGKTRDSVRPWTNKKKQIFVRPGVGIPGSLNYLGRWTGTSREFMRPSFRAFGEGRVSSIVDRNIDRMLDVVAKEAQK